MTWFLKSKIKKQIKLVNELNQDLIKAIKRYNELVAEYNMMNNFVPILPQQQLQQEQARPVEQQQQVVSDKEQIKQIVTKGGKVKEIPSVVEI